MLTTDSNVCTYAYSSKHAEQDASLWSAILHGHGHRKILHKYLPTPVQAIVVILLAQELVLVASTTTSMSASTSTGARTSTASTSKYY